MHSHSQCIPIHNAFSFTWCIRVIRTMHFPLQCIPIHTMHSRTMHSPLQRIPIHTMHSRTMHSPAHDAFVWFTRCNHHSHSQCTPWMHRVNLTNASYERECIVNECIVWECIVWPSLHNRYSKNVHFSKVTKVFRMLSRMHSSSVAFEARLVVTHMQGGEDSQDALSCRLFFAKEPLIIGLFCGKWPMKIRHLMTLRHPVCDMIYLVTRKHCVTILAKSAFCEWIWIVWRYWFRDSFWRVTLLTYATYGCTHVWCDSFSFTRVTCFILIHTCDVTCDVMCDVTRSVFHFDMWHDSHMWRMDVLTCDMARFHSRVWRASFSFTRVTWRGMWFTHTPNVMCDVTRSHSRVWRASFSFTHVTWLVLIHTCHVLHSHSHVWRDVWYDSFSFTRVTCFILIHTCDVTCDMTRSHSRVWRASFSFTHATWRLTRLNLIPTCDVNRFHSHVWHDSFSCSPSLSLDLSLAPPPPPPPPPPSLFLFPTPPPAPTHTNTPTHKPPR